MLIFNSLIALTVLVQGQCGALTGVPLPDIGAAPPGSGHLEDVPYGANPLDIATVLDFYKADSPYPTPVLIEAHGGGWSKGDKSIFNNTMQNSNGVGIIEEAYAAGFSVVSVQYNLVTHQPSPGCNPANIQNEYPTPTCPVFDIQRVMQFLRHHAEEWDIDPDRMAAIGQSAGGHLALWGSLSADQQDVSATDPVLHHSSRLPFVIAIDTPTDLTASWVLCTPTSRPAFCNFFGQCDNASITGGIFDQLRLDASPVYQASLNRSQNQRFELLTIYQGNPSITLSSQYPPSLFPTIDPHHHVFGLLIKEALAAINNNHVRSVVHLVRDDPARCAATLETADWLRSRVRDPLMLTIEPSAAALANPTLLAPVFRLNLGQIHARDFIQSMQSDSTRNFIQVVLKGQTVSPVLGWQNLTVLHAQGALTIRVEENVIEIEFAPMDLAAFGGQVHTSFTAGRKDFRKQTVLRDW